MTTGSQTCYKCDCLCLHLDLGFEGDGVVHQEPIRGGVKVRSKDEVGNS